MRKPFSQPQLLRDDITSFGVGKSLRSAKGFHFPHRMLDLVTPGQGKDVQAAKAS